jgi:hypothetical protein
LKWKFPFSLKGGRPTEKVNERFFGRFFCTLFIANGLLKIGLQNRAKTPQKSCPSSQKVVELILLLYQNRPQ